MFNGGQRFYSTECFLIYIGSKERTPSIEPSNWYWLSDSLCEDTLEWLDRELPEMAKRSVPIIIMTDSKSIFSELQERFGDKGLLFAVPWVRCT